MTYSKAHVILDAAQFAADANTSSFGQLIVQNSHVLTPELALRILLTFLPESTPPSQYAGLAQDVALESVSATSTSQLPQPSKELSNTEASERARKLRLLPLKGRRTVSASDDEPFVRFILSRARKVDTELGSLTLLQELVEPFVEEYLAIKEWTIAVLMPLVRLDYEYYPDSARNYSLDAFERLHGRAAVEALTARTLENKAKDDRHFGRDLRGIVGPWILGEILRKNRKAQLVPSSHLQIDKITDHPQAEQLLASSWNEVYEWFLALAAADFLVALEMFKQWDGPQDVDYGGLIEQNAGSNALHTAAKGYAQTGLAILYERQESELAAPEDVSSILAKVAKTAGLLAPPKLSSFDRSTFASSLSGNFLATVSTVHILTAELLEAANPLTKPSSDSLELAFVTLISTQLLDQLGLPLKLSRALSLALFASQSEQLDTFRRILHGLSSGLPANDIAWSEAREKLLWLRGWQATGQPEQARQGIFAQIAADSFENEILKALVTNGRYDLAVRIYCKADSLPLPNDKVEQSVLEVVMASYDNASNGNRTRGGMKKANEIRIAFESQFPASAGFRQASALIFATHRLSYYSLTLRHGVPLLPVNIRVSSDPLGLVEKVLKQNPHSYTKLDDLLDIGRDLVKARLVKNGGQKEISADAQLGQVERSIIAKAIEASLAEDDFDTAYSYIVNRLSVAQPSTTETSNVPTDDGQEILWKAAYQAGRYRPKRGTGPSELRRLEQRIELLSQALLLAPPISLQKVLYTWRNCEMELNTALAKETEEEQAWNEKGQRTVPGGFTREDIAPVAQKPRETTRKAMNEEAPMSLFDVTRNAATALSKSAFPLRGQRQGIAAGEAGIDVHMQEAGSKTSEGDAQGRIRKRDMVSNMVTGGLASGIGWVIGKHTIRYISSKLHRLTCSRCTSRPA